MTEEQRRFRILITFDYDEEGAALFVSNLRKLRERYPSWQIQGMLTNDTIKNCIPHKPRLTRDQLSALMENQSTISPASYYSPSAGDVSPPPLVGGLIGQSSGPGPGGVGTSQSAPNSSRMGLRRPTTGSFTTRSVTAQPDEIISRVKAYLESVDQSGEGHSDISSSAGDPVPESGGGGGEGPSPCKAVSFSTMAENARLRHQCERFVRLLHRIQDAVAHLLSQIPNPVATMNKLSSEDKHVLESFTGLAVPAFVEASDVFLRNFTCDSVKETELLCSIAHDEPSSRFLFQQLSKQHSSSSRPPPVSNDTKTPVLGRASTGSFTKSYAKPTPKISSKSDDPALSCTISPSGPTKSQPSPKAGSISEQQTPQQVKRAAAPCEPFSGSDVLQTSPALPLDPAAVSNRTNECPEKLQFFAGLFSGV